MKKSIITVIFGTRPEAIKMCPLINEMKKHDDIDVKLVITGQHGNILNPILKFFDVKFDFNLEIMKEGQSLFDITEKVIILLQSYFSKNYTDYIMVHGDTTSAFASALCGFYLRIPVIHVEAGLRTYNIFSPYPEEFNRVAIDRISSLHFCPTEENKKNLLREGIKQDSIFVTGNTVIDALSYTVNFNSSLGPFSGQNADLSIQNNTSDEIKMLMTMHRRENHGNKMIAIFKGVKEALNQCENLHVLFPCHPNPNVRLACNVVFGEKTSRLTICEPMDVFEFHQAIANSNFILSDSGGIQEEAVALNTPLLLARENTERMEGVLCGNTEIVGCAELDIKNKILELCYDKEKRKKMQCAKNPFGDGNASKRIVSAILSYLR